jgi:pimeloyl-ACP methyl ester carboxylesterase
MAADLHELVEAEGLGRVCLLGHSMGGKTAMQFALTHPEKTDKLVVEDIAPKVYGPRHEKIFSALLALDLAQFQKRGDIEEALAPQIPDLALRRFLLKNLERNSMGGFQWKIGLSELRQNNDRLLEGPAGRQPFAGPALFIRGEHSEYLVPEDLPAIQTWFSRAELRTIPGAGHLVHVDQPDAFFLGTLGFFMDRQKPRNP